MAFIIGVAGQTLHTRATIAGFPQRCFTRAHADSAFAIATSGAVGEKNRPTGFTEIGLCLADPRSTQFTRAIKVDVAIVGSALGAHFARRARRPLRALTNPVGTYGGAAACGKRFVTTIAYENAVEAYAATTAGFVGAAFAAGALPIECTCRRDSAKAVRGDGDGGGACSGDGGDGNRENTQCDDVVGKRLVFHWFVSKEGFGACLPMLPTNTDTERRHSFDTRRMYVLPRQRVRLEIARAFLEHRFRL